jgi:PAS domain-containing protein
MPDRHDVNQLLHQTLLGDAWENARVAVAVLDDDRHYLAFNTAFCRLTGYRRDDLLARGTGPQLEHGRGVVDLAVHGGETVRTEYWAVETTVSGLPYVVALFWRDGSQSDGAGTRAA